MTRHSVYREKCMSSCWLCMGPNLSLNPHASPAALTRRPLGAG